ncbi:PAS domain-containing protein [Streptomyces sp. NPDC088353]|uniref:PAS domain-containing protein n=1 Tax=Streptomyces sp. NPDC088353 TaxID=3365855 RepID=UPI0038246435
MVLDNRGTVLACTPAVEELLGVGVRELIGRPFAELLAEPGEGLLPSGGPALLLDRGGRAVEVRLEVLPLSGGSEAQCLVRTVPLTTAADRERDDALVRALFRQTEIGLVLYDADLRIVRTNQQPDVVGLVAGTRAGPGGVPLDEVLVAADAEAVGQRLRRVAETGRPVTDEVFRTHRRSAPEQERVVSLSALRLENLEGCGTGVAVVFSDITDREQAERGVALLRGAEKLLLGSLDIVRTAEGLAGVLVPEYADLAAVDLAEAALGARSPLTTPSELHCGGSRWPPGTASGRPSCSRSGPRYESGNRRRSSSTAEPPWPCRTSPSCGSRWRTRSRDAARCCPTPRSPCC